MEPIDRRLLLGAAGLAGAAALSRLAHAGPITPPPGPVSPTGLTLDGLAARSSRTSGGVAEPRIPVTPETCPPTAFGAFTISQPGSYYLTGDLASEQSTVLYISTSDVTVDLCGYAVRTLGFATLPIEIAADRVAVRGGVVAGFTGVRSSSTLRQNHLLEDLRLECVSRAVFLASRSAIRRCTVRTTSFEGIYVPGSNSLVSDCIVSGAATGISLGPHCGVERCHVSECPIGINAGPHARIADSIAVSNGGVGILAGPGGLVQGCVASSNPAGPSGPGIGISVGNSATVTGCRVNDNAGGGIVAGQRASIDRCDVAGNAGRGISVGTGSRVTRCAVSDHTTGTGPAGVKLLGNNCIVEENYFTNNFVAVDAAGVSNNLVARNTCLGNANFISVSAGGNWYPNTPLGGVNTDTNPHNNVVG